MRVAVVGSRNMEIKHLGEYLPEKVTEIVSGGARGIDACARKYALENGLKLKEFFPEYNKYGKVTPLKRNLQIIDYADQVIAFWDGHSKGIKFVIENCRKQNKRVTGWIFQTVTPK